PWFISLAACSRFPFLVPHSLLQPCRPTNEKNSSTAQWPACSTINTRNPTSSNYFSSRDPPRLDEKKHHPHDTPLDARRLWPLIAILPTLNAPR
ncbi:uncharacterized protein LY79DRAFT_649274, partial [Colletotrichum navitas]